jgi:hypothetical protein
MEPFEPDGLGVLIVLDELGPTLKKRALEARPDRVSCVVPANKEKEA